MKEQFTPAERIELLRFISEEIKLGTYSGLATIKYVVPQLRFELKEQKKYGIQILPDGRASVPQSSEKYLKLIKIPPSLAGAIRDRLVALDAAGAKEEPADGEPAGLKLDQVRLFERFVKPDGVPEIEELEKG